MLASAIIQCALLVTGLASDLRVAAEGHKDMGKKKDLDFLTEQEAREKFEGEDFIFDFEDIEAEGPGGNLRPQFIFNTPALATLPGEGVGQNLVTLEPCGINQAHHHPRGTEFSHIIEGKLTFFTIEENDGRIFNSALETGQTVVVPQGLIHGALNLECEQGAFLASFPTRDPGTVTTASNFFRLSADNIAGTIPASDDALAEVTKAALDVGNPSINAECAKRCGLKGY